MSTGLAVDIQIPSNDTIARMAPPLGRAQRDALMQRAKRLLRERPKVIGLAVPGMVLSQRADSALLLVAVFLLYAAARLWSK